MSKTIKDLLNAAGQQLANLESPRLDAEILLAHALDVDRSFLYAHPDFQPSAERNKRFHMLIKQRKQGQPIAYLTGIREFWSLPLQVSPDVLIPRPETETLVESALSLIPEDAEWPIADLGTGSGAIALALASERQQCAITASDASPKALEVARKNAMNLGLGNIEFAQGNWFEPLSGPFRMVVSNPPYVAMNDPHLQQGDCRYEPETALTPGGDGLPAIRIIANEAPNYLLPQGWLLLEHGYDQAESVRDILSSHGFIGVHTVADLEERDRITLGQIPI